MGFTSRTEYDLIESLFIPLNSLLTPGIIRQTVIQADTNLAPLALRKGISGSETVQRAERRAKHVLFLPIPRGSQLDLFFAGE